MDVSGAGIVSVYTVAGASSARLPDWLARKNRRKLRDDPDWNSRITLLQDFEFPVASTCIKASEDGNYIMSSEHPATSIIGLQL